MWQARNWEGDSVPLQSELFAGVRPRKEVVDLHVRVPVVAVPYLAALLEQGIRLVEQEDPPALLDRSDPHVLLCKFWVLSQDFALKRVALLTTH